MTHYIIQNGYRKVKLAILTLLIVFIWACNSSPEQSNNKIYRGEELMAFLKDESIPVSENVNVLVVPTVFCKSCVDKADKMVNESTDIELVVVATDNPKDIGLFDNQKIHIVNRRKLEQAGLAFPNPRFFEIRNSQVTLSKGL